MILQLELSDEQLSQIAELVAVKIRHGKADTYSVQEVADKIGVHKSTITNRVNAGLIPKVPGVGRVRIPAAFVDKMLNPHSD